MLRQMRHRDVEEFGHHVLWFADTQPADRAAGHVSGGDLLRALGSKVGVHPSLNDAKELALLWFQVAELGPGNAAIQPAMRAVHGVGNDTLFSRVPNHVVERHHDV